MAADAGPESERALAVSLASGQPADATDDVHHGSGQAVGRVRFSRAARSGDQRAPQSKGTGSHRQAHRHRQGPDGGLQPSQQRHPRAQQQKRSAQPGGPYGALEQAMTKPIILACVAAASLSITSNAAAQTLASRVDNAPDGRVQFTFAAKSGVCGNG